MGLQGRESRKGPNSRNSARVVRRPDPLHHHSGVHCHGGTLLLCSGESAQGKVSPRTAVYPNQLGCIKSKPQYVGQCREKRALELLGSTAHPTFFHRPITPARTCTPSCKRAISHDLETGLLVVAWSSPQRGLPEFSTDPRRCEPGLAGAGPGPSGVGLALVGARGAPLDHVRRPFALRNCVRDR